MANPVESVPIPDQESLPRDVFSLDVSSNLTDADSGDTIVYSLLTTLPVNTGFSFNAGTGSLTGTPTQDDVNDVTTITIRGTSSETGDYADITFAMSAINPDPPSAVTYYVNGSSGLDTNNGTSLGSQWRTITRANQVQPDASGNVLISVAPGTYVNQPYIPQFSGTDDTHRIILDSQGGDGTVIIDGPASGQLTVAIDLTAGQDYITVTRGIRVQGTTSPATNPLNSNIKKGMATSGNIGLRLQCETAVLEGFNCNEIRGTDTVISDTILEQCGSPDGATPQADRSDGYVLKSDNIVVDGVYSDTCGHYHMSSEGSDIVICNGTAIANWDSVGITTSVATGSLPYGNHVFQLQNKNVAPFATDNYIYNYLIKNAGWNYQDNNKAVLSPTSKMIACEGQGAGAVKCWLMNDTATHNGLDSGISVSARDRTGGNNENTRLAHQTIIGCRGAGIRVTKEFGTNTSGLEIVNNCFKACSGANTHGTDVWIDIDYNGELPTRVAGNLFPSGTINIRVESIKTDTLAGWEASHASVFHDNIQETGNSGVITFVDEDIANATIVNVEANFKLHSASDGINGGVNLTTAVGAGSSSTSLTVVDASWFRRPVALHIGSINVGGTDATISSISGNVITLASAISWSNGDGVNIPFSGSAPDCGASQ